MISSTSASKNTKLSSIVYEVKKQASKNTKFHCLYGRYFLNLSLVYLSKVYNKSIRTINRWIYTFKRTGTIDRKERDNVFLKFNEQHRAWLISLYKDKPILYLRESKKLFLNKFDMSISASEISVILRQAGLSWHALERRAIQLHDKEILRFSNELWEINWILENLVFLDEVSFDNSDMLRKRGYGIKGKRLIFRGEFCRKARVSLLCFLGVEGIINCYSTEGTFNRTKFAHFCREFALDPANNVQAYPGRHSIWILDGAQIHLDKYLVSYLRSLGIIPLFLPAYAPMFNPIEIIFGLVKRELKEQYVENSKCSINLFIGEVFNEFSNRNVVKIFRKCGYLSSGRFDPGIGLSQDIGEFGFVEEPT